MYSAHGTAPRYGSSEASPAKEPIPPRSRALCRGPSQRRQSLPCSRPPPPSPPRGLGAGQTPPRSRPPSSDYGSGPTTRRDGAHLFTNHSTAWGGSQMESGSVSRRRSPRHTADLTGVPSAYSGPCATIPGAVQDYDALCGLA